LPQLNNADGSLTFGRSVMDRIKELIRQHWDRRAAEFDKEASHGLLTDRQSRAWHNLIGRVVGEEAVDALDIGCGTGFLSLLLAEFGHRVVGIDFAESMLAAARHKATVRKLDIDFRCTDAEAPDLAPNSFDLIVERHVFWTLPHPLVALDSWRWLLREGGRLLLIEGQWKGMQPRDEYLEICDQLPLFGGRPVKEIAEMILSRGFRFVDSEPLMEPELWLETPAHLRYLIIARR
jgi:SAM-dependent methyltransferase